MPVYAYPITIQYTKRTFTTEKEVNLGQGLLSIEILKEELENPNDQFSVETNSYNERVMTVYSKREETEDQYNSRIEREERYMKEYHRRKNTKEGTQ